MSNTIELLESIGRNASLRHASRDELVRVLDAMEAGEHLKQAAATGDRGCLAQELGDNGNKVNHNVNEGGCDPGDDEAENESIPDEGAEDSPGTTDR